MLLADDHQLVRDGLRLLLEESPAAYEVVGEAADGRTAVELAARLQPDLVVLDVSMPDLGGLNAAAELRRLCPRARIVALSAHHDPRVVRGMLDAGARAYVGKDAAFGELRAALDRVMRGQVYLSPSVAAGVGDLAFAPATGALSPREREVVQLIAEGLTSKEIAGQLDVSVKTIEAHRKQIMDKLGIRSIAGLTKWALREGLTPSE